MATLTVAQAADALRAAGWPAALIPVMVGVGRAESGLRVDAQSPPNRNGTIDRGWLQINSVHHYDAARLLSDPVYTATAALTIYKSQGLKAWSTYNSGAYKVGVPDLAATAAPAGAQPGARLAAPVASVENVGLSDAVAGAGEQVATAVQPFAYRALLLAAAAGLVMVGLYRATKPATTKLVDQVTSHVTQDPLAQQMQAPPEPPPAPAAPSSSSSSTRAKGSSSSTSPKAPSSAGKAAAGRGAAGAGSAGAGAGAAAGGIPLEAAVVAL